MLSDVQWITGEEIISITAVTIIPTTNTTTTAIDAATAAAVEITTRKHSAGKNVKT